MAFATSKYQPLTTMVAEWSAQSGELEFVILRRICDWAICGEFPDGAFVLPTGQAVDILTLHRAMRSVTRVGAPINEDLAIETIRQTIVSKAAIKDYCERMGVDLPLSLSTLGSRVRRFVAKGRHIVPPECPNGFERVIRLEARWAAIGLMNTMKSQLPRVSGDSKFAEQARERWLSYADYAQSEADASGDLEIQMQLAALKEEWETPDTVTIKAAANADTEA